MSWPLKGLLVFSLFCVEFKYISLLKNIISGEYTREMSECRHNGICNENLLSNKINIDNTDFFQEDKCYMT